MALRKAIDEVGSIHHVILRGNNRNRIFPNPADKDCFLRILRRCVQEMNMKVLHYVVMDNHYHLLVEVGEISLDRFMMRLNRGYSWYFNRRYRRTGTIFEGRYHNYVVQSKGYYWSVVRYIVNNPVKSMIVDRPEEYEWSSHQIVCNGSRTFLSLVDMLYHFAESIEEAVAKYFICTEGDFSHVENSRMLQPVFFSRWEDGEPDIGYAIIVDSAVETPERLWVLLRSVVESSDLVHREKLRREQVINQLIGARYMSRLDVLYRPLRDRFVLLADADGHAHADIASFIGVSRETVRRIVKVGT